MSTTHQSPDTDSPRIIGRWAVPLANVIHGKYGRRKGQFVYTVYYESLALYTGMTCQSISKRLRGHMQATSNLGRCIHAAPIEMFSIDVAEIEGNTRIAERIRIEQLHPALNLAERNRSKTYVERVIATIARNHKKSRRKH